MEKIKNLFKNFKLSAFGILFIILCFVAIATWFVPAGEYSYMCGDTPAFVYENVDGKEVGVCPTSQEISDQLVITQASEDDNKAEAIETIVTNNNLQPATYEYQEIEPARQGIWNVIEAPVTGFIAAIEVIVFVFTIGGFINIVIQSGAMDAGVYALLKKFKGRELVLIPILMTLFALGGTSYGMAEETVVFYIILIPILFKAGFDNAVGMMTIALGAGVGTLASTVNPFAIGVAASAANVSQGAGIIGRIIFFVVTLLIAIWFVMRYAKKVKKDPTKSINYNQYPELEKEFNSDEGKGNEVKMTGAHGLILAVFGLTFVLMILSVIPWSDFGITIFEQFAEMINGFALPVVGGDAGILPFGQWYFIEMTGLFLASSFIVGCIAKANNLIEENTTVVNIFIDGARDMMGVALTIGLARGIQGILESSGMAPTLLYYGSQALSQLPKTIFIILAYIFYIPLSFLVPSTSGLATATMPIIGSLADSVFGSSYGSVQAISAFSFASGLVNLVTPTSGVIMAALSLSKMDYGKWIKLIMPLIIILFVVSILFLVITTGLNFYM